MECLELERGITVIQDNYNANPTATKEVLQSISAISRKRTKVAILGDMLELGKKSASYHLETGEVVASLSYDLLFTLGEYGIYTAQGAREEGMAKDCLYHYPRAEKHELASRAMKIIPDNSIVLLKGSRALGMEEIVRFWQENEKVVRKNVHF